LRSDEGYFAEDVRGLFSSRILVRDGKSFFEYWDENAGTIRVEASTSLKERTAEDFIEDHGFIQNDYKLIDEDILSCFTFVRLNKSCTNEKKSAVMRLRGFGEVLLTVASSGFVVESLDGHDSKIMEYKFWKQPPESIVERQQDFSARFAENNTAVKTVTIEEQFDFAILIDAVAQDGEKRPIPLDVLSAAAIKYNYFLPEVGQITQANGMLAERLQKALDLEVKYEKKTYSIGEYIPKMDKNTFPKKYITGERSANGIHIVRLKDLGTKATLTYFFDENATYILNGDHLWDKQLETVIRSFRLLHAVKKQ